MSLGREVTCLVFRSSYFKLWILIGISVLVRFSDAALNETVKPTLSVAKDCSLEKQSCRNCTAYSNCVWCFAESFCAEMSMRDERGKCKEDDWYRGDCDKPEKDEVLLYVLLGCALFLLVIVILLVVYIFFCKVPRSSLYSALDTKEPKKREKRTPLMSKKFKPVGSRTDELKKKYGLQ